MSPPRSPAANREPAVVTYLANGADTEDARATDPMPMPAWSDEAFPVEERLTEERPLTEIPERTARVVGPNSEGGVRLAEVLQGTQGYVEVTAPGQRSVWRWLPVGSFEETLVSALEEWHGASVLRHWAAFRRIFQRAHGGLVAWRLDDHLDAFGGKTYAAKDPGLFDEATAEAHAFTEIEVAVYDDGGAVLWCGKPLRRLFSEAGSRTLDEMLVQVHPLLLREAGAVRNLRED